MFIRYIFLILLIIKSIQADTSHQLSNKEIAWQKLIKNMTNSNIQEFIEVLSVDNVLKNILLNKGNFDIKVSAKCKKAGLKLIAPFTTISLANILPLLGKPFGKVIDSWGKPTPRILLGSMNWLGAYDECKAVDDTKFCFSKINIMNSKQLEVLYGSCFPRDCNQTDIAQVFNLINSFLQGKITFQPGAECEKPIKYETGAVITIILMAFILMLCLFATFIELKQNATTARVEESAGQSSDGTIQKKTNNERFDLGFISSFSLIRNTKAIMSTEVREGSITCINGVRVISLTWVILGHIYFMLFTFKPDNSLSFYTAGTTFTKEAIVNATVSVDSFFLLSGLLVAYLTLKRIDSRGMGVKDVLMYYLHRYIRLTPSLGIIMLFYTNILPLMISGPTLATRRDGFQKPCLDYWWTNLLFINNFYPVHMGEQCYGLVWYLANDMQFYVVAPFILLVMVALEKRFTSGKLLNFIFILFLCGISLVTTGILIEKDRLYVIGIANNATDPGGNAGDEVYEKPYTRITTYLIGMFLGYMFSRKITIHTKITGFVAWIIAAVIALAVVYGPYHVYHDMGGKFSDIQNLMYGIFARVAWGCSLAWVIYACHHKVNEYINSFLSWKVWLPLSRLSYGSYLIHMMVIFVLYFAKSESGIHYQDTVTSFDFVSVTAITFGCSYILTVCVDYPVQNLEKIVFKR